MLCFRKHTVNEHKYHCEYRKLSYSWFESDYISYWPLGLNNCCYSVHTVHLVGFDDCSERKKECLWSSWTTDLSELMCLLQWVDLPCENVVLIPSIRWWLFASRIVKNQLVQHILVISSINCSLASQWIQNSLRNRSCTFSYCSMFAVLVDRSCTGRVHCMKACM